MVVIEGGKIRAVEPGGDLGAFASHRDRGPRRQDPASRPDRQPRPHHRPLHQSRDPLGAHPDESADRPQLQELHHGRGHHRPGRGRIPRQDHQVPGHGGRERDSRPPGDQLALADRRARGRRARRAGEGPLLHQSGRQVVPGRQLRRAAHQRGGDRGVLRPDDRAGRPVAEDPPPGPHQQLLPPRAAQPQRRGLPRDLREGQGSRGSSAPSRAPGERFQEGSRPRLPYAGAHALGWGDPRCVHREVHEAGDGHHAHHGRSGRRADHRRAARASGDPWRGVPGSRIPRADHGPGEEAQGSPEQGAQRETSSEP